MWDVLSGDFDYSLSKEKCLKNVISNANMVQLLFFMIAKKHFKTSICVTKSIKGIC